jgi:hypothetical protein
VAELAGLGLLATGPDAGVEDGLFRMKTALPLPPRGLLAKLRASFQLMASGLKKQVARRCSSLWKAGSAWTRSGSSANWLSRIGMGPAATCPSNKLAQQGFCHSWMAGMLFPLRAGLESTRSLPKGRPAQDENRDYAKKHKQRCDRVVYLPWTVY